MKSNLQNTRDLSIDLLRTIGILFIILAHVDAPFIIKQIRIFDVVLLVVISGYVYKEPKDYVKYIYKRVERLVFPTWLFLTVFFLGLFLVEKILKIEVGGLNRDTIISSYTFWWGIGFVWIIRIYLGVAILGPIVLKKLSFNRLILYYIILEAFIVIVLKKYSNGTLNRAIELLPYILVFCYGNLLKQKLIPLKRITYFLGLLIILFIFRKASIDIGSFKYPPRLIYIWYGLFISNVLFLMKDNLIKIILNFKYLKRFIEYIGKSTMWLYLIHIGVYYIILFIKKKIILNWKIEYLMLVLLSLGILFIKDKILGKFEKSFKSKILNILKG